MEKDVDVQALSAAIAGFLACHILTCRFLVQEGVVDQDRFSSYLETAMAEMAPGIEDKRTLFSLRQLITALRAPLPSKAVHVNHAHRQPHHTMPVAAAGPEIERLIQLLARLPGLGPRSARRAALFLIKKREQIMAPLAAAMHTALEKIEVCRVCGNIDSQNPCTVCTDVRRDPAIIVVVADVADLWALERAHAVNARYHVLGGTLSPLDGIGPEDLSIDALVSRAHAPAVTEVILALNATVDGQTTAHYITDLLHDANVKVTRLAHGVPVGGELDYLDEGTLAAAIRQRTTF